MCILTVAPFFISSTQKYSHNELTISEFANKEEKKEAKIALYST